MCVRETDVRQIGRTYRVGESAEVQDDRVECDDAHGLNRVAIYDVGRQNCIAGL